MILKLVGGPMDGAGYVVVTANQLPDGIWFNGKDEHGRLVHNQYLRDGEIKHISANAVRYSYDGQVVETGISFETGPAKHESGGE